jgi:hypothetical protein
MSTIALKRARLRPEIPAGVGMAGAGLLIGTLQRRTAQGEIFVDYPGNDRGPVKARILLGAGGQANAAWSAGDTIVLLLGPAPLFEPVVLGLAIDRLPTAPPPKCADALERDVTVDGRRIVLDAQSEVVLRCGAASITLNATGKIVIKGAEIVSRSSGANKIKGALVNIN